MPEEKKGPGRPRKYKTDAERKKAYRERKKVVLAELKEKVDKMEKKMENMLDIEKMITPELKAVHEELKIPWMKLTPNEITNMQTEELKKYRKVILRNFGEMAYTGEGRAYPIPVLDPFINLLNPSTKENYSQRVLLAERMQQIVLLYLIEAELASRKRELTIDDELDNLMQRVTELESRIQEEEH